MFAGSSGLYPNRPGSAADPNIYLNGDARRGEGKNIRVNCRSNGNKSLRSGALFMTHRFVFDGDIDRARFQNDA